MRRSIAAAAAAVLVAAPAFGQQSARLDSIARAALASWNVPGFAVAVVRGDSVVFAQGYGVRERGGPAAVDQSTVFYTASVTKGFTAAAIGALVDQGKVRGTDPITRFIPTFTLAEAAVAAQLTVVDLLGHRTGFPRADLLLFSGLSDSAVTARLRTLAPSPTLRSRLAYNNQMYQVMGQVVATVAGEDFASYLERSLLTPLGMRSSNARGPAGPRGSNAATPHGWVRGEVRPLPVLRRAPYGGGAVNASAVDLAQWVRLLIGGGMYGGRRILSEGIVSALRTPMIVGQPILATPGATIVTYGLGGYVYDYRGYLVYANLGQGEGWSAAVVTAPSAGVGVVVLANMHASWLPQAVAASALDIMLGLPPRDWLTTIRRADGSVQAPSADVFTPVALSRTLAYEGTFEHPLYGELTIVRSATGLSATYSALLSAQLLPSNDSTFRANWSSDALVAAIGPGTVRFRFDGGTARSALLELGQERIEFVRRSTARGGAR